MPLIGILALQGDVREHELALRASGASTRAVRSADQLSGIDGLVIPGGESTTIGKLAANGGLLEPLRAVVAAGAPVYGSCAGMILLANEIRGEMVGQETVGGLEVAVRRNAFGRQVASFELDLDIAEIGEPRFPAIFIRAPWVEEIGSGVEVLACLPDSTSTARIVAVRQGQMMATAFHPELTADHRVHKYFVDIVRGIR